MEYKNFKVKIKDIIPQQHYLSRDKYEKVKKYMDNNQSYGDIYVIEYKNKIFSVDGHHRLLYLYKNGIDIHVWGAGWEKALITNYRTKH